MSVRCKCGGILVGGHFPPDELCRCGNSSKYWDSVREKQREADKREFGNDAEGLIKDGYQLRRYRKYGFPDMTEKEGLLKRIINVFTGG